VPPTDRAYLLRMGADVNAGNDVSTRTITTASVWASLVRG